MSNMPIAEVQISRNVLLCPVCGPGYVKYQTINDSVLNTEMFVHKDGKIQITNRWNSNGVGMIRYDSYHVNYCPECGRKFKEDSVNYKNRIDNNTIEHLVDNLTNEVYRFNNQIEGTPKLLIENRIWTMRSIFETLGIPIVTNVYFDTIRGTKLMSLDAYGEIKVPAPDGLEPLDAHPK